MTILVKILAHAKLSRFICYFLESLSLCKWSNEWFGSFYCTHLRNAADIYIREYLSRLGEGFSEKILRLHSDFRRPNFYDDVVMNYCLFNEERTAFRTPAIEELDQFDVVVSTASTCRFMANNKSAIMPFTHIILDEAGQCLEIDSLIPFKIATNKTRLIMAGDPAQQAPPVFSKIARRYKYNLSPMERMFLLYHHMGNDMLENNSIIFCNNYRCVQPILDFLSPQFYAGNMLIAKSTDYIPPEHYPLVFSHCQGKDMVRGHDMSYTNPEECERIVDEVKDLMINWPINHWGTFQANQICVLAPYHEQVKLIRQRLKSNGIYGVDVQRVNNVQGQEYRVVMISVVRTLEGCYDILAQLDGEEQFEDIDFAFLSDRKLLNSAMSRAKNKIIVVGDASTMIYLGKCQEIWQAYIIHCIQNQSVRPVSLHPAAIEKNLQQRQDALQAW